MLLLVYPRGKNQRYPLYRRLGGPHSQSARYGEEKFLPLSGNESQFSDRPACLLETTTATATTCWTFSRLVCKGRNTDIKKYIMMEFM
jgi:hypothetical protein